MLSSLQVKNFPRILTNNSARSALFLLQKRLTGQPGVLLRNHPFFKPYYYYLSIKLKSFVGVVYGVCAPCVICHLAVTHFGVKRNRPDIYPLVIRHIPPVARALEFQRFGKSFYVCGCVSGKNYTGYQFLLVGEMSVFGAYGLTGFTCHPFNKLCR